MLKISLLTPLSYLFWTQFPGLFGTPCVFVAMLLEIEWIGVVILGTMGVIALELMLVFLFRRCIARSIRYRLGKTVVTSTTKLDHTPDTSDSESARMWSFVFPILRPSSDSSSGTHSSTTSTGHDFSHGRDSIDEISETEESTVVQEGIAHGNPSSRRTLLPGV